MNQPAKAQEPSMEEILASIRRIIADDDTAKPAKPEPPKPAAAAPVPAPPPPPPPKAAPAAEPAAMSQDDIDAMLAGFDQPPPAAPAPPSPPPEPEADILDLTEAMAAPAPAPEPTFRTIGTEPDVMFAEEPEPEPAPPRAARAPSRPVQAVTQPAEPPMLSATTTAAVDAAFNSLAQTVLVHNARTLEDLIKEMLRPMLKSWLDDNLPNLVERLVRAEIERVSRGRG
jgi:uncharacterized protein